MLLFQGKDYVEIRAKAARKMFVKLTNGSWHKEATIPREGDLVKICLFYLAHNLTGRMEEKRSRLLKNEKPILQRLNSC